MAECKAMCIQASESGDRERRELRILLELVQSLNRGRSLEDVASPLLRMMAEDMDMMRGTITILNRKTRELTIEAAFGLRPEQRSRGRYKLGEGVTGLVAQTGRPAVVPRVSREPLFLDRTGSRIQHGEDGGGDLSFICVPIRLTNDTIGALSIDRVYSDDTDYTEDIRLLTIAASLLGYQARRRQVYLERRIGPHGSPSADGEEPITHTLSSLETAAESTVPLLADQRNGTAHPFPSTRTAEGGAMDAVLKAMEQKMILDALDATGGNMAAAARQLGLTERMMGLRVHRHGIDLRARKGIK